MSSDDSNGKAKAAVDRMEYVIKDTAVDEKIRVDFLYLQGLAFEQLSETKKFRDCFRQVSSLT